MTHRRRVARANALAAVALLLAACANNPPVPAWELSATSGLERARDAWFAGDARGEAAEFAAVRYEIARTGRPALLARAELVRCALRAASLEVEACRGFEALAGDAEPAEHAYAAYLRGSATPEQAALLPEPHRPLARSSTPAADLAALDRMADPLARLVGASVLLQTGRGSPGVVEHAVRAASSQGWRRPLRAWLQVQLRQAESAGDLAAAARIGRRIALVDAAPAMASPPVAR